MAEPTSQAAEALRAGNRVVLWGIAAIVAILALAAVLMFLSLPDANAFNERLSKGKPGDKLELTVERKGKRLKLPVVLGST